MTSSMRPSSVLEGTFGETAKDSWRRRSGYWGGSAAAGRLVTAVRFRESDCRLSSEDVTYPSAGILLLNFSKPRGQRRWGRWWRGGFKKEKNITEISYEIIPKKHQRLLVPVTILPSSHEHTEGRGERRGWRWWVEEGGGGVGGAEQLWATCGQKERTAAGRRRSVERQECLLGDHRGDDTYYLILMRQAAPSQPAGRLANRSACSASKARKINSGLPRLNYRQISGYAFHFCYGINHGRRLAKVTTETS